ncbi:MAG: response regulator transcription factor [Thermomicrobiales bacterium]
MTAILIVEDDREIAQLVRDYLDRAGYSTSVAQDGDAALIAARNGRPDLIVLDLGLPKRDGLDVIREIRTFARMPIVILTARGEETDRIVGLELGADDYIVKPFSPREVVARVRAVLRRTSAPEDDVHVLRRGAMEIDVPRMRVSVDGAPVELTATEFQLLATMARRPGQVFTRGQLLDAVRGDAFEGYERAIDAHIKNIRRKIEPDSAKPTYIPDGLRCGIPLRGGVWERVRRRNRHPGGRQTNHGRPTTGRWPGDNSRRVLPRSCSD